MKIHHFCEIENWKYNPIIRVTMAVLQLFQWYKDYKRLILA
jgi:hypothetical protein